MTENEIGLPEFENPPVVEVALSVQFESLPKFRTPQVGLLWREFRDRFPSTEEHPPIEAVIERFGTAPSPRAIPRIEVLPAPRVPRCWFLNEASTELIQVQQDRFVHNWRKVGDGDTYPRFDHLKKTFEAELRRFELFLSTYELGTLNPNQCEVTYVNQIDSGRVWTNHGQLGEVLTLFSARYTDDFSPALEDARLSARFIILNDQGHSIGRLHVAAEPVFRSADDSPMFTLTLTARGRPLGSDNSGVLNFLSVGREWIVRTFASITTAEMHTVWKRTR
jgi:uncharacterized protein (TIGR04255 family)